MKQCEIRGNGNDQASGFRTARIQATLLSTSQGAWNAPYISKTTPP